VKVRLGQIKFMSGDVTSDQFRSRSGQCQIKVKVKSSSRQTRGQGQIMSRAGQVGSC